MTYHVLHFLPQGLARCTRCHVLMTQEQWAANSECRLRCTFCGQEKRPVHVCFPLPLSRKEAV